MNKSLKSYIFILFLSMSTLSCGSSTSNDGGQKSASGGIGGTGISQGPITAFGSIFVNGVEFETDSASVTIDDQAATDGELKLGMFVTVMGSIDGDGLRGQASSIDYEADIEGPIDSLDFASNSLVVMGQNVIVDGDTLYEGVSGLSDLAVNDVVSVSGLVASGSTIQATLIEREDDAFVPGVTLIEVKGLIQQLDKMAETFFIASLKVNYTGSVYEDFSETELVNDLFVEVEGTRDALGVLNATRIEKEGGFPEAAAGALVEIEGFVTSFTSTSLFSVGGQAVSISSSTIFEGGTLQDIQLDARLEVKGVVNASGVLEASEVSFRGGQIKIEAPIDIVDVVASQLTLLGQKVFFNSLTEIEDESDAEEEPLSLSQLQVGERLEVSGRLSGGLFIAKEVRRHNPENTVSLQGPVALVSQPGLKIFAIDVVTTDATRFEAADESAISDSVFFDTVSVDQIIKAEGLFEGSVLIAEEIEFK